MTTGRRDGIFEPNTMFAVSRQANLPLVLGKSWDDKNEITQAIRDGLPFLDSGSEVDMSVQYFAKSSTNICRAGELKMDWTKPLLGPCPMGFVW
jgi:hypothetical protein